ncbi:MAG: 4Fe-4S single cluster domain-containing protein [Blastocatellia bacterium]
MTPIPVNLYPTIFPRLNVAEADVVEGAAGPGRRLVVWLQGCLKRCPGCANGPFLPEQTSRVCSVDDLLDLLDACPDCEGVTLSGGEPVLQAEALAPFLQAVRQRGLTVTCYSGYTLEELTASHQSPVLRQFLEQVDLLIDGEYQREAPRGGVYRPTSNQRLHFLSGRITPESCAAPAETVFDLRGGRAFVTGTLPSELRRRLIEKLRAAGVILTTR